jgi:hypothetical protein
MTVILVLLMEGNCKCTAEFGSGVMINLPSLMKIGTGVEAILRFSFRTLTDCNIGITHGRDLRCAPLRYLHIALYVFLSSMTIGSGI